MLLDKCSGEIFSSDNCSGKIYSDDYCSSDNCSYDKCSCDNCSYDICSGDNCSNDKCSVWGDNCSDDNCSSDNCSSNKCSITRIVPIAALAERQFLWRQLLRQQLLPKITIYPAIIAREVIASGISFTVRISSFYVFPIWNVGVMGFDQNMQDILCVCVCECVFTGKRGPCSDILHSDSGRTTKRGRPRIGEMVLMVANSTCIHMRMC